MSKSSNQLPLILLLSQSGLQTQFIRDLSQNHFDLVLAETPFSALEMLNYMTVNILILDERLLKEDIFTWIAQAHAIPGCHKLPILVITKNLKLSFKNSLTAIGVTDLIRQPLVKEEVLRQIKNCQPSALLNKKVASIIQNIPSIQHTAELDFKQRFLLNNKATRQIKDILNDKQFVSLLMIEMDNYLKHIQTYGERISSPINLSLAESIKKLLRPQDVFIPLGGAKFMVVLPKTSEAAALAVAEELQNHSEKTPVVLDNMQLIISLSIGIATRKLEDESNSDTSFDVLSRLASIAKGCVIQAKEHGHSIIAEPTT